MNGYKVYCQYLALKMHFDVNGKYDYFKYEGKVSAKPESFLKRRDKAMFSRLAKRHEPIKSLIANFMFNPKKNLWVGDISEEYLQEFEKIESSGAYIFKNDLNRLKNSFWDNFELANGQTLPYILRLLREKEISYFTVCVFQKLLKLDDRWQNHDSYMIFEDESKKIVKSVDFFKIDDVKYREMVLSHFNTKTKD